MTDDLRKRVRAFMGKPCHVEADKIPEQAEFDRLLAFAVEIQEARNAEILELRDKLQSAREEMAHARKQRDDARAQALDDAADRLADLFRRTSGNIWTAEQRLEENLKELVALKDAPQAPFERGGLEFLADEPDLYEDDAPQAKHYPPRMPPLSPEEQFILDEQEGDMGELEQPAAELPDGVATTGCTCDPMSQDDACPVHKFEQDAAELAHEAIRQGCGHVDPDDETCGHPDSMTPECHYEADCPVRGEEPADDDGGYDLLEMAWVIIANAFGGDWSKAPEDWRDAAAKWRDLYHETLPSAAADTQPEQPAAECVMVLMNDLGRDGVYYCETHPDTKPMPAADWDARPCKEDA